MSWYEYVFGAIMILGAITITVLILMQQSRSAGLSGAIAGGADNFLGKNKGRSIDAKLARYTKVLCVIFFLITLVATFFFAFMKGKLGLA